MKRDERLCSLGEAVRRMQGWRVEWKHGDGWGLSSPPLGDFGEAAPGEQMSPCFSGQ